jgi:hypothetical protein
MGIFNCQNIAIFKIVPAYIKNLIYTQKFNFSRHITYKFIILSEGLLQKLFLYIWHEKFLVRLEIDYDKHGFYIYLSYIYSNDIAGHRDIDDSKQLAKPQKFIYLTVLLSFGLDN